MKVLMTGATGFIGSRLCERLIAEGVRVRAAYRNACPSIVGVECQHMPHFDDGQAWLPLLRDVDAVIHLAALAHQVGRAGVGRWEEFKHVNVDCTAALVRACATASTPRFIFISSVAVYGVVSGRTIGAGTPTGPVTDYGRSKLQAEEAIQAELAGCDTDWCIIRPPLVYGPGNPGNMERLLRLLRTGLPLPFGAIRNLRSFVYVDNLIDAIVAVLRHGAPIRSTYALADGTELSTPDLVRALATASGLRARVFAMPVWMLRLMAKAGDVIGAISGRSLPFDSYSVDRLRESLAVDGTAFATAFRWIAPVESAAALRATCGEIMGKRER